MKARGLASFVVLVGLVASAHGDGKDNPTGLPEVYRRLIPFHERQDPPKRGEWLATHQELPQTFVQYRNSDPIVPTSKRYALYVQPLGDFSTSQRRLVSLAAEYMEFHFGLQVKTQADLSLKLIPAKARRTHPTWGNPQILSTFVLEKVLRPRLPRDAAAMIAFTESDLWPGEGWNYLFGQASLDDRVGVWSIYRYGDPDGGDEAFQKCLRRTLKVSVHETGHMFSLQHCTLYQCVMAGSNHLAEADSHPMWLCPECLAKVCWATRLTPEKHYERLAAFCRQHNLAEEQAFFEKSLARLRGRK
jgi:archaemetzincin